MWTLKDVGGYIRTAQAPKLLTDLLKRIKSIFNFTQERENRLARYVDVINDYKAGMPVKEIEQKYGCSTHTVLRYARLAQLPKRPKGFDPQVRETCIILYKEGKPVAEIAAKLGVSEAYISKLAKEVGINRRDFKNPRKKRVRLHPS